MFETSPLFLIPICVLDNQVTARVVCWQLRQMLKTGGKRGERKKEGQRRTSDNVKQRFKRDFPAFGVGFTCPPLPGWQADTFRHRKSAARGGKISNCSVTVWTPNCAEPLANRGLWGMRPCPNNNPRWFYKNTRQDRRRWWRGWRQRDAVCLLHVSHTLISACWTLEMTFESFGVSSCIFTSNDQVFTGCWNSHKALHLEFRTQRL